jgi:hypothetical protein
MIAVFFYNHTAGKKTISVSHQKNPVAIFTEHFREDGSSF